MEIRILIVLLATRILPQTKAQNGSKTSYSKYPEYPPYCSTPEQMKERQIPPLPSSNTSTVLVHVTAVLHHGARTILGPEKTGPCWEGFWEKEETAVWDCDLNTYLAPPSYTRIYEEEEEEDEKEQSSYNINADPISDATFLFNLEFDALKSPLSNILNGTCQEGQLLMEGYDQAVFNGEMLRNAYLYDELDLDNSVQDSRMRLFATRKTDKDTEHRPWNNENIYVRSGDDHRTLMSGQLFLSGLFGNELKEYREQQNFFYAFPSIPVHTADHTMDILGGFQKNCPKLDAIRQDSYKSKEFLEFYNSAESQMIRRFMEDQLSHDHGLFDCLMTTICTDRPLPEQFGDYDTYKSTTFDQIATYHTRNHSFPLLYNNAEYSKLSIGPLWAEILDHITPVVGQTGSKRVDPARMAVYSGYDTTIMQLLSSLGEEVWDGLVWPPYASMLLIEIHQDLSSEDKSFLFRLLYNGEVLTSRIPGCESELCDALVLIDRVSPFATRAVDCVDPSAEKVDAIEVARSMLSKTGGLLLVIFVVCIGAAVGGAVVVYRLTGALPDKYTKNRIEARVEGTASVVLDELEMTIADASPYDPDQGEESTEQIIDFT